MINEWVKSLKSGLAFLENRKLFFLIGFFINLGVCLIEFKADIRIVTVILMSIIIWFLWLNVIVYVYKKVEADQLKEERDKLKANLQNLKEQYQKLLEHYNVYKEYLEKQKRNKESNKKENIEINDIDDLIKHI